MFKKWTLYIFLRGTDISVYFGFTVPFKIYSGVLIRVVITIPRCCSQKKAFFCVVANNAETNSPLFPTMPIIFPCCRQQRGKVLSSCLFFRVGTWYPQRWSIVCIVDHSVEKWSALLPTPRKMISIVGNNAEKCLFSNISMNSKAYAIYTKFSIRGLGWRVSWLR